MKGEGKNRTGYKSPRQVQGAIPVPGLSHQWLVIRWLNPLKPAVFFHLTNGKPVSSFLLSLVVETPCQWGGAVVKGHPVTALSASFHS